MFHSTNHCRPAVRGRDADGRAVALLLCRLRRRWHWLRLAESAAIGLVTALLLVMLLAALWPLAATSNALVLAAFAGVLAGAFVAWLTRPSVAQAARLLDEQTQGQELALTALALMTDDRAGDAAWRCSVLAAATQRFANTAPAGIALNRFSLRAWAGLACVAVAAGIGHALVHAAYAPLVSYADSRAPDPGSVPTPLKSSQQDRPLVSLADAMRFSATEAPNDPVAPTGGRQTAPTTGPRPERPDARPVSRDAITFPSRSSSPAPDDLALPAAGTASSAEGADPVDRAVPPPPTAVPPTAPVRAASQSGGEVASAASDVGASPVRPSEQSGTATGRDGVTAFETKRHAPTGGRSPSTADQTPGQPVTAASSVAPEYRELVRRFFDAEENE